VNALVAAVSDRIALDSNAGGGIGEIDAVLVTVENRIADDRVPLTGLDPHADLEVRDSAIVDLGPACVVE
jgi:hypothetical protein